LGICWGSGVDSGELRGGFRDAPHFVIRERQIQPGIVERGRLLQGDFVFVNRFFIAAEAD
jgi:hypothetical protein